MPWRAKGIQLDRRWQQVLTRIPVGEKDNIDAVIQATSRVLPAPTTTDRVALAAAVPAALAIRDAVDPTDRDTLEPWLLSRLDNAGVAQRTGMEQALVQVYHDLFYDVRPWLEKDPNEVAWVILGSSMYGQIPESDVATMKRYIAIQGGEQVLAAYLDYLSIWPVVVPSKLDQVSTQRLERMKDALWMRVYVLSHVPLNPAQGRRLEVVLARKESMHLRT